MKLVENPLWLARDLVSDLPERARARVIGGHTRLCRAPGTGTVALRNEPKEQTAAANRVLRVLG